MDQDMYEFWKESHHLITPIQSKCLFYFVHNDGQPGPSFESNDSSCSYFNEILFVFGSE